MTDLRWPIEPLIDYGRGCGLSLNRLSDITGLSGSNLIYARTRGLTDHRADVAATRLGVHPCQLWPDWFAVALRPTDHDYLATGWRQAWLWNEKVA